MRTLKTVLLVTLAATLSIACGGSEQTTSNANQSARTGDAATPNVSAANSNQPAAMSDKKEDTMMASKDGAKVDAAAIYDAQKCGICHGPDGKGKVKGTPDFSDAAWQTKTTDAEMINQIKKGKVPQMPAYESKLNDAEITALVAYIRAFKK